MVGTQIRTSGGDTNHSSHEGGMGDECDQAGSSGLDIPVHPPKDSASVRVAVPELPVGQVHTRELRPSEPHVAKASPLQPSESSVQPLVSKARACENLLMCMCV